MILHDLFDWSNAGIGVVGLGFTLWAVAQATGAKSAAREARQAVYQRNAADALVEIVLIAEQLNASVLYEHWVEASMQMRELAFRIPRDREEFARFLASDGDKLRSVESNCIRWAADILVHGKFPLRAAEKNELFKETLNTVQELGSIQGRLRRMLDREEK
ncbi:MAG: hypothetical protein ABR987_21850 [Terracidiphilus sp.]|jgi:hypothetical protein